MLSLLAVPPARLRARACGPLPNLLEREEILAERQQRLLRGGIPYSGNGATHLTLMNQDQYAALLQKFIQQEREVSRRELKWVEAKANLTGYQAVYVTGPYVAWETAEAVAEHESQVAQAEKALQEAREDLGQIRVSLVENLPVTNIGVVVQLKHTEDGPAAVRVKAVLKEDAWKESPESYALFINDKEY
jgi:hypothetical protein